MNHTVKDVMTKSPFTVGPNETAAHAGRIMQSRGIHHLPVVDGETLVGLVTERDLRLLVAHRGPSRPALVREAMSREPFVVGPDSPLSAVARLMADQRVSSAVVLAGGQVVGILCVFDALHALSRLTNSRTLTAQP